ncbi:MAG: hypothetical protein L0I24_17310, partial [Pseudonocardia sp.]|nr:hypothetical protein [Pseudonocardia sp.]
VVPTGRGAGSSRRTRPPRAFIQAWMRPLAPWEKPPQFVIFSFGGARHRVAVRYQPARRLPARRPPGPRARPGGLVDRLRRFTAGGGHPDRGPRPRRGGRPRDRHPLAQDEPARAAEFRDATLEAYRAAYAAASTQNRAPLAIGNHFNDWSGGRFSDAVEAFIPEMLHAQVPVT